MTPEALSEDGDTHRPGWLDWAVAGRPAEGYEMSGDVATVRLSGDRCVLAVVDGIGHGPQAATAAIQAMQAIEEDLEQGVTTLLESAHRGLLQSRGAAVTVAIVEGPSGRMRWLGVGNVEGVLLRRDEAARPRNHGVFLRSGVLGRELPSLRYPDAVQLHDGDRIAIATDGVRLDLADALGRDLTVDRLAEQILAEGARPEDDALVLVACYRAPV